MPNFDYTIDEELPPRASLASSLSSMTYDFERAVADVVDNSIPVESTKIWVKISDGSEGDYGEPYVAIVDNGDGMNAAKIREALVYGSPSSMETRNLGRFGLGMKTASTSQAWILTVASRMSADAEFDLRQWNIPWLDNPELNPEGKWFPLIPNLDYIPNELYDLLEDSTGTIVLWTDLSKMLPNIRDLNRGNITQALTARATRCRKHMELVFHRFIEGTCRHFEHPIEFFVNGQALEANDPFQAGHRAHRAHNFGINESLKPNNQFPEDVDDGSIALVLRNKIMRLTGHVIPRSDELHDVLLPNGTTRTAAEVQTRRSRGDLAGSQGIYFYRLDRLIQDGSWSRAYASEPHYSLARIGIEVNRDWDDEIQLNVTKTKIERPDELKTDLGHIFSDLRVHAENVYRLEHGENRIWPEGEIDPNPQPPAPPPPPPPPPEPPAPPEPPSPGDTLTISQIELIHALKDACESDDERALLTQIIERTIDSMEDN